MARRAPQARPAAGGGIGAGGGASVVDAFRKPDFSVAAFVRDAKGGGQDRLARLTQQLEEAAGTIDEELQREIVGCHEELLQNAGSISDLDGQLGDVREVVDSLRTSVGRVRTDLLTPFHGVKRQVVLLQRMQSVNVLIRKLLRFLFDARKLRTQMEAPSRNYSIAAHTLHELEGVLAETGIDRIDVMRQEVAWIREVGAKVRKQAEEDLRSGTKQGNQVALGVSLQVFYNLHCLWPQLKRMLAEMFDEFHQTVLPAGGGFQASLEMNLQVLVAHTQRVYLLDEMLRTKTDPLTHCPFSSALEEEGISSLTAHFWTEATALFRSKLSRVLQDRSSRKAIISDFPKFLSLLAEAMDRVNLSGRGRGQVLRASDREALYATVSDLRTEFISESARRVNEPVDIMLPEKLVTSLMAGGERIGAGGTEEQLPTSHDLRRFVQLIVVELERNECCPDMLLKDVVRNARASVLLFVTRLEQLVDGSCVEPKCFEDGETLKLRSPLPVPMPGYGRNARLFGIAHNAFTTLRDAVPTRLEPLIFTPQVQACLRQTQGAIVEPMMSILRRAVDAGAAAEAAGTAARGEDGASAEVSAVVALCVHMARQYFSLFGDGQLLSYLKELCIYFIRSFLSAVALAKPCPGGALRDLDGAESALGALDPAWQEHVRHEALVFAEFRKLVAAPKLEDVNLAEAANVIPQHLLLTYLVHQLPGEIPSLPAFGGMGAAEYLRATLLPLWEEKPAEVTAFRSSVASLADKHSFSPMTSAIGAFVEAQVR